MRSLSMTYSSEILERQLTRHCNVARRQAAVDRKRDPGDRGSIVGSKKGDCPSDIARFDNPAERIPARERRQHLRVLLRTLGPNRRANSAGQHDIHTHAETPVFQRERSRKRNHPRFGGAISRIAQRREAIDRANIDDDARPPVAHAGENRVGAVVGAVQIGVDIVAPTGGIRLSKGRMFGDPGVVDEDVNLPLRAYQSFESLGDLSQIADVNDFRGGGYSLLFEFGREIAYRGVKVDCADSGSLGSEMPAKRLADAARCACDRDELSAKSHAELSIAARPSLIQSRFASRMWPQL